MTRLAQKTGAVGIGAAMLVAQVILPAAIDLVLTCALMGLSAWGGWKAAQEAG